VKRKKLVNCLQELMIENNVELLPEFNPYSHYLLVQVWTADYEMIVAMIHARSKLRSDSNTQRIGLSHFYRDIAIQENELNCKNTIAIGDFNASPFENACICASGMHAIPFPDAVKNTKRRIDGREYQKLIL